MFIGLLPGVPSIEVTPELVSLVVLPPLLFAAGEELPWRDLRAVWRPVTALAAGWAGIALRPEDVRQEQTFARLCLAKAGLEHLDGVADTEAAPEHVIQQLRQSWEARAARIQSDDADEPDNSSATTYRALRRELLAVEGAELDRLFDAGAITDSTRRRIQRVLDLEQAGLGEDEPSFLAPSSTEPRAMLHTHSR